MTFSNKLIWENRNDASASNGGGFNPANANFAADLTTDTNTGNTASPIVSSASYNFVAGDVGHWVFIQSGTNWTPGWYLIASVAANKATLTAGIGTAVLYGTSSTGANYQRPNGLNTTAGCATVGTPTSGVWSVDYSQNASAFLTFTDMVIDATTNTDFTSAGNPVDVNMLGNIINVTSGTGFTVQRVEIMSIPSGVIGRVDKSLGTLGSTGGNGALGGAVGTSALLSALSIAGIVAGNWIFIKATGTYTLTVTTTVTAAAKGDTTNGRIRVEGYTTYRGEADGRPTITSATNSVALFTINDNDYTEWVHLKLTHTAATRGNGWTPTGSNTTNILIRDCVIDGCLSAILDSSGLLATLILEEVEVENCTSSTAAVSGATSTYLYGCDIHATLEAHDAIFDTNAKGINSPVAVVSCTITACNCLFVDNTSDGIGIGNTTQPVTLSLSNNVFYGNGGYGINNADAQAVAQANSRINRNNAFGSNASGALTGFYSDETEISLTADPFTNKAGRDFTPNSTAGGGALLRAAGFPGAFVSGTTTDYKDVGIQHRDPARARLVIGL